MDAGRPGRSRKVPVLPKVGDAREQAVRLSSAPPMARPFRIDGRTRRDPEEGPSCDFEGVMEHRDAGIRRNACLAHGCRVGEFVQHTRRCGDVVRWLTGCITTSADSRVPGDAEALGDVASPARGEVILRAPFESVSLVTDAVRTAAEAPQNRAGVAFKFKILDDRTASHRRPSSPGCPSPLLAGQATIHPT